MKARYARQIREGVNRARNHIASGIYLEDAGLMLWKEAFERGNWSDTAYCKVIDRAIEKHYEELRKRNDRIRARARMEERLKYYLGLRRDMSR